MLWERKLKRKIGSEDIGFFSSFLFFFFGLPLFLMFVGIVWAVVGGGISEDSNLGEGESVDGTNLNEDESGEITNYGFGDKVIIGNFAYVFHNLQTRNYVGSEYFMEEADGIYLIFDVTIENVAKESKTIWGSNVVVVDDQNRRFEHDVMAEIYLDDSFSFEQMQPELPKRGKIVFDVPTDLSGYLEVSSDSFWSSEVKYVSWAYD